MCVVNEDAQEVFTYIACPVMPEAVEGTAVVTDETMEHLYGCAVCAHLMDDATNMFCERCRPGYNMYMGGCYNEEMGTHTPNDDMCQNCATCLRFDRYGSTESVY